MTADNFPEDTSTSDVTLESVANKLEEMNYRCSLTKESVYGRWNDIAISFSIQENNWLEVNADYSGLLPKMRYQQAFDAANAFNSINFLPTLYVCATNKTHTVQGTCGIDISEGLTAKQLEGFLEISLYASIKALEELQDSAELLV